MRLLLFHFLLNRQIPMTFRICCFFRETNLLLLRVGGLPPALRSRSTLSLLLLHLLLNGHVPVRALSRTLSRLRGTLLLLLGFQLHALLNRHLEAIVTGGSSWCCRCWTTFLNWFVKAIAGKF